jgi:hypothetical protein
LSLFKDKILEGLRENLDTSLIEFAKDILELPEGSERESLIGITFSEIFNMSSLKTQDDVLNEMIKPRNLYRIQNKGEGLKIKEIEGILKCERALILKTLESLEMTGGMNGWKVDSTGIRRGKRYCLKKIN